MQASAGLVATLVGAVIGLCGSALAADRPVPSGVIYRAPHGLCPSRAEFAAAVERRMATATTPSTNQTVQVTIERRGHAWVGEVGRAGSERPGRVLTVKGPCRELAEAMALTVALMTNPPVPQIAPPRVLAARDGESPQRRPRQHPVAAPHGRSARRGTTHGQPVGRRPWAVGAAVGVETTFGGLPGGALQPSLGMTVTSPTITLWLSATGAAAMGRAGNADRLSGTFVGLDTQTCWRATPWASLCARAQLGQATLIHPAGSVAAWQALVGLSGDLRLSRAVVVRLALLAPFDRMRATRDGRTLWQAWPVVVSAGFGVGGKLL